MYHLNHIKLFSYEWDLIDSIQELKYVYDELEKEIEGTKDDVVLKTCIFISTSLMSYNEPIEKKNERYYSNCIEAWRIIHQP